MTFIVKIIDNLGIFTKRGYKTFEEAEEACRLYALQWSTDSSARLIYARVIDSNGRVRFDFESDEYDWENPDLNEDGAA